MWSVCMGPWCNAQWVILIMFVLFIAGNFFKRTYSVLKLLLNRTNRIWYESVIWRVGNRTCFTQMNLVHSKVNQKRTYDAKFTFFVCSCTCTYSLLLTNKQTSQHSFCLRLYCDMIKIWFACESHPYHPVPKFLSS